MTWYNKVLWTEGMFLQPQHFQQHDRYTERYVQDHVKAAWPYGWGFLNLTIDEPALQLGKVALSTAQGLLADGTSFQFPGSDAAPAALDVPPDVRDELLVLAIALQRPGVAVSNAEITTSTEPPRYQVLESEINDSNAHVGKEALVQLGRLNLRLMLARDAVEGFATIGVARIVERRADNRVILDPTYIPPMLQSRAHIVLDGYTRELYGLLHQRGEALAARLTQPGRSGTGEISDFLLLQTVNRNEPLFAHLQNVSLLHPERLYCACLALAGDLATFQERRRPSTYAPYQHDDLAHTFQPVIADLRHALSMVLEQTALPIELQDRQYGVRVALIPDVELQRNAQFVLAVAAQMPSEAVRGRFPTQVKIGPVERIRDLVNLQLPGVELRPLPVAPRQIPYHAGFNYFELNTRGNPLWKQLEASGGLAMHIAGDFPGMELEFWAIRG